MQSASNIQLPITITLLIDSHITNDKYWFYRNDIGTNLIKQFKNTQLVENY